MTATQNDVMLDLLAIVDDAPVGRLVGGEETTIQEVTLFVGDSWDGQSKDCFLVALDNGQRFKVQVREVSG